MKNYEANRYDIDDFALKVQDKTAREIGTGRNSGVKKHESLDTRVNERLFEFLEKIFLIGGAE